jgi:hypothetical protein
VPTWLKAAPSKSKPMAPRGSLAASFSQTKLGCGSTKRTMSQQQASRSTQGLGGELVSRLGVGVSERAGLDAPNSLSEHRHEPRHVH